MRVRVESFYNIDVEESPPDSKGNFIFHLTEEEFNKVLKLFTENLDAYIEDALKSKGFNLYGRQDFSEVRRCYQLYRSSWIFCETGEHG